MSFCRVQRCVIVHIIVHFQIIMPELPEVETVLQGIKPHLEGKTIQEVIIRQPNLRWSIPTNLVNFIKNQTMRNLSRRAKYLLIPLGSGTLIIHLGMSGSLVIVARTCPPKKHDHVDILFSETHLLRYNDPRRFGAILWTEDDPQLHPLLCNLGPEPLAENFNAEYLFQAKLNRRVPIKTFIMDSKVVVGVGNIYAAESLFLAKIHPQKPAFQLSQMECELLVSAIKLILQTAILRGGTSLRDFVNSEGKLGYFKQELQVYGRGDMPCTNCNNRLVSIKLNQRSTVYCGICQPF